MTPMTDHEFSELLAELEDQNVAAARYRHAATEAEITRAEAVNLRMAELAAGGASLTQADKLAHAEPEHRAAQRQVAQLTLDADLADRKARALGLALEWAIAGRRAEFVRVETVQ